MLVSKEDYEKLLKNVEAFRKITQGCYGSMTKLKEKVSDLEVKVSDLQEKLGNMDIKSKKNENETIDDEIKRIQECQRKNVDKIEDIDQKINNLREQQEIHLSFDIPVFF